MNKILLLAATLVAGAAISGCDRKAAAPAPAADTAAIADAIKAGRRNGSGIIAPATPPRRSPITAPTPR